MVRPNNRVCDSMIGEQKTLTGMRSAPVALSGGSGGRVNQTFDIYSGDTVDIAFTLTDIQGLPLVLTDLTLWWGMGEIRKVSPEGITIEDNIATVHLEPDDTIELTTGGLRHQLRAVDPNGRVETFAIGVCRVTESVFQPSTVTVGVRTLHVVGGVRA